MLKLLTHSKRRVQTDRDPVCLDAAVVRVQIIRVQTVRVQIVRVQTVRVQTAVHLP